MKSVSVVAEPSWVHNLRILRSASAVRPPTELARCCSTENVLQKLNQIRTARFPHDATQDADTWFFAAVTLLDVGNWTGASEILRRLLQTHEGVVGVQARLAQAQLALGNVSEAECCLKLAIQGARREDTLSMALFELRWVRGDFEASMNEAQRYFEVAKSSQYEALIRRLACDVTRIQPWL